MTHSIFVYISTFFLLLSFFALGIEIPASIQLSICLGLIFLVGIPHGANDNGLYRRGKQVSNAKFIATYVASACAYIAVWLVFPLAAYVFFLLMSAYHFGQSQFLHYFGKSNLLESLLYGSWGVSILSGLVYFNLNEVVELTAGVKDFEPFAAINSVGFQQGVFISSTALTIILLVLKFSLGQLKRENLLIEFFVIFLVQVSFYVFPFLIGFTMFFVILHSMRVLKEEYHFLIEKNVVRSFKHFVLMLIPFTALSVFGFIFCFGLIKFGIIDYSYAYVSLILIAAVTFPHVHVMNRFYQLSYSGLRGKN